METRANYILIGVFTLAGFAGLLAFFMWFARFELDRQFAYYDINFTSVSGLSRASDVRFSGLPVGQVVDVGLSPEDDGTVMVRIEIDADTPVRADSVATIEAQGVTGVSFVSISAGSPEEPRLIEVSDRTPPEITSGRSVLQSLTEDAPEVLAEVLNVLEQVSDLLGEENQERVDAILANLEISSESFAAALDDFGDVAESVALAATGIAEFADRLDEITEVGTETMRTAESTLTNLSDLAVRAQSTLEQGDEAMTSATATFDSARQFMDTDLTVLVRRLSDTTDELRADLNLLTADARGLISEYTATGAAATARLNEAEATLAATDAMIARLNETLGTVDSAAGRVDTLLEEDGAAIIAEARAAIAGANEAIATISTIAETDLPVILAEFRTATETANRVMDQVGSDVSGVAGRFDGLAEGAEVTMAETRGLIEEFSATGAAATARLNEAEATLAATDAMIAQLNQTLATVDSAAGRADTLLEEDGAALVAEARAAIAGANEAIAGANEAMAAISAIAETDLPATMTEIRTATETANRVIARIGSEFSGATRRFGGLAEGAELTMAETRDMIEEFSATSAAATARLNEAEATLAATDAMIARLDQTLATVDSAAGRVDTLLEEDGAALVAEARSAIAGANEAIATISTIAESDLPVILSEIRSATETANRVIAQVGGDLSEASGRVEGLADGAEAAMASVGETFGNANETLAAINDALVSGERTLEAAERAFTGADRVINEDISDITGQLRETMARLDTAIAQVSDDIPGVTAELRSAAETANIAFTDLGQMVGAAGGAVSTFANTGLPEYTRLAQETRALIASLERLTRQIEREPARFFLDRQTPEFRR